MDGKCKNQPTPENPESGDQRFALDFELVSPPANARRPSNRELRQALQLALLATSAQEQQIIGFAHFHSLPLTTVALRLGIPFARAKELHDSLSLRLQIALERARKEMPPQPNKKAARAASAGGKTAEPDNRRQDRQKDATP